MSKIICTTILVSIIVFFGWGCADKPDVKVSVSGPRVGENKLTIVRSNVNMLRHRPQNELEYPVAKRMINQGDQIIVLEEVGDWSRVQHVFSGDTGWVNNSFIQIESKTKWWSGDTDKARRIAEKMYKDKIFLKENWPIIHISIEERWNKCTLITKEGSEFSRKNAATCSEFIIDQLSANFPGWRDHQVFVDSNWKGTSYSLAMSNKKKALFF